VHMTRSTRPDHLADCRAGRALPVSLILATYSHARHTVHRSKRIRCPDLLTPAKCSRSILTCHNWSTSPKQSTMDRILRQTRGHADDNRRPRATTPNRSSYAVSSYHNLLKTHNLPLTLVAPNPMGLHGPTHQSNPQGHRASSKSHAQIDKLSGTDRLPKLRLQALFHPERHIRSRSAYCDCPIAPAIGPGCSLAT
jgi:hypothetical protein